MCLLEILADGLLQDFELVVYVLFVLAYFLQQLFDSVQQIVVVGVVEELLKESV